MRILRNAAIAAAALGFGWQALGAVTAGKVVIDPWPPTIVGGLTNIVQVAAGPLHVVGIQPDGTLAFWAAPNFGSTFPSDLTNVTQVSALWHHGLALTGDGKVHSWGDPFNGATDVPPGLSNVVAVAAGTSVSYALLNSGSVVKWGSNSQDRPPASLTNAVAITAGEGWCAALRSDRTIVAWGGNIPVIGTANAASNIVSIASGFDRLLALRDDGSVWSSANDVPEGLTNVISIAAGYQKSLALTADGALIKWPGTEILVGVSNVVALGGGFRPLAVANVRPIFLTHPDGRTNYTSSTATFAAAVGGTMPIMLQWLRDNTPIQGQTNLSLTLTNLELSATGSYSLAASNAFGVAVSSNAFLSVIDGPPVILSHPVSQRAFNGQTVQLEAGFRGSLPLSFQWRFNGENIPNANEPGLEIASIQSQQDGVYAVEIINPFGAVVSSNAVVTVRPLAMWGTFPTQRIDPPLDLTNGIALSSGSSHFLALSEEGRIFTCGYTNDASAGFPATATNLVWISASSGSYQNLAVGADGSVHGWGRSMAPIPSASPSVIVATSMGGSFRYGLTSEGKVIEFTMPPRALPWSNVVQISAGRNHLLGLQNDGIVVSAGFDTYGQVALPPGLSNVVSVAAGGLFSMAMRRDGTILAWGDNRYGQCNVPSNLTDVVTITGGDYTAYALKSDGTVLAWGRNNFGQAEVPAGLSNVIAVAAGLNQAAALIGPPELRNRHGLTVGGPRFAATSFCVDAKTERARTYILEASLDGQLWSFVRAVAGNGFVQPICDPNATNSLKLYRVRSQ